MVADERDSLGAWLSGSYATKRGAVHIRSAPLASGCAQLQSNSPVRDKPGDKCRIAWEAKAEPSDAPLPRWVLGGRDDAFPNHLSNFALDKRRIRVVAYSVPTPGIRKALAAIWPGVGLR